MSRRISLSVLVATIFCFTAVSQAAFINYQAILSGPAESPPNASPGFGIALVDVDTVAHTMRVQATFSGLVGNTTLAHIHSATLIPGVSTAGVATTTPFFAGFPIGVTAGSYDNTLDMTLATSYNPTFITNNGGTTASAEAALFQGIADGKAYFNIHTTTVGSGEIRGFLVAVPEPSSLAFLAIPALMALRRRARA